MFSLQNSETETLYIGTYVYSNIFILQLVIGSNGKAPLDSLPND